MQVITHWLEEHNLSLNTQKTKILPFSINKKTLPENRYLKIKECEECQTDCNCHIIETTKSIRYLGVQLDCHLRWEEHINNLRKRLRRYIYTFLTLRKFMPLPLLKEIYYSLIQSAIEYGICAYGRANPSFMKKLKTAQNIILKIIYKKENRFSTHKLYEELNILNIDKLFQKNLGTFVHKKKDNLLKTKDHKYNLRTKGLVIPKCNTNIGQKQIDFIGIKIYQKIPTEIKLIEEIKPFKMKFKEWLKNNEIKV
ncbi:hypothetical protein WDU94_003566 [Cyamophila willieti]